MKNTKKFLGIALATVMAVGLLAGCGAPTPSESTSGTSANGADAKVLNIATIGETTTLSPLYMIADNHPTSKLIYEGLVKYVNGEIKPCLAESWDLNTEGTVLTFHLRQGVQFHDGEPWNAEAAKANIEFWHTNPAYVSLPGVVGYTSIEATDDYTLTLTYDHPYYAYLNDFCWPDVCVMVSPKQIVAGDYQTVNGYAGTGPYVYGEYIAGQYTTFVRNENYWGDAPYYDEIVAKYIPEASSRLQALKTGEIDLIYGSSEMSYEDYNQAASIDGVEGKFASSGSTVRNLTMNFNGNLSDLRIRQAIAYAVDKEGISDGLTYGFEPVANTIIPDGTKYSDITGSIQYSYDVDKANQLLDEAGWVLNTSTGIREKGGNPLHIVFTYSTDDASTKSIATLIKSQLAEVGIDMEVKGLEKMEWYMGFLTADGFDITSMSTFYNYAMPHCWYSAMLAQMPQDVSIPLLENSDEFISELSEFKTCNDDARLKEIFQSLIGSDLDQVLDLPLTYQMDMIVYNKSKIADYNFASDYQFFDPAQITPVE
ncbi:MAG: ABC transporter substrate-binding protein [Lachnospiraceae bacterium]|nr:ABC transporter substrate-binding protein [Lachnospiraceae bacterium]